MMKFYSPLRYPGGKNRLAKFIAKVCFDNDIYGHYVEPYAGGASVALYLLLEGKVGRITINDYDRSIYAFWYSVLHHTKKLCDLIESTELTVENWEKEKEVQRNKESAGLLELGFSTLFLNRTNRSGVLDAGIIGGKEQGGKYKMDCRFNKQEIISKIKNIAKRKKDIALYQLDALELVRKIQEESNNTQTIFYFDPPYYLKGASLYMNFYKNDEHREVAEAIRNIENIHWIVSYDDTSEIEVLYSWAGKRRTWKYFLQHSVHTARQGAEILFCSKSLVFDKSIGTPLDV